MSDSVLCSGAGEPGRPLDTVAVGNECTYLHILIAKFTYSVAAFGKGRNLVMLSKIPAELVRCVARVLKLSHIGKDAEYLSIGVMNASVCACLDCSHAALFSEGERRRRL